MTTTTIVFAIVGFIAAVMFATKKVSALRNKVLDKLEERVEQKELDVLAVNKERFKSWSFVAGDVRATIVNYQWVSIYSESGNATYDSYHNFIESEYRQNARVTAYEYEQLALTEEALRDCRAGRVLTNEDTEVGLSNDIKKATIIDTDDYGTLVKYAPNQLINVGGTSRMAAHLITNETGDIFINELHVAKKGFSATSSVTVYHVADALGNRSKEWSHAFQVNVEAKRDEWNVEVKALNELKDTLNKWNKHRHLLSFDTGRGVWIIQPMLPMEVIEAIVDPGKTEEDTTEVIEEPVIVTEDVIEEATEVDPAELALDAIGRMTQEQLDNLTRVLAESSGYIRPELVMEEAAISNN